MNPVLLVLCLLTILEGSEAVPEITVQKVDCVGANGIGTKIYYTFTGGSDFYWVGLFRQGDPVNNPITWAWTCRMSIKGCVQPAPTGQGTFFIPKSQDILELRLLSKTNQMLAQTNPIFANCSSSSSPPQPVATFKQVHVLESCGQTQNCFTSISSALSYLANFSGGHMTIRIGMGSFCASDLKVRLNFTSVSFVGQPGGTGTTIKYCSTPQNWPGCQTDCYYGSSHFMAAMNGVSFRNLTFDGRSTTPAVGHPSLWDPNSQIAVGMGILNWIPSVDDQGKRIEGNIVAISNFTVEECRFSFYETAAIYLVQAQFSIKNNTFDMLGSFLVKKRQGHSGIPYFGGPGNGGTGVKVKGSSGSCSRNGISRGQTGVDLSDSDPFGTETRDVTPLGVYSTRVIDGELDISENNIDNVTYGIAAGFLSRSGLINITQNEISDGAEIGMVFASVKGPVSAIQNHVTNATIAQQVWDCGGTDFDLAWNQLMEVEVGVKIQQCSPLFGQERLLNGQLEVSSTIVSSLKTANTKTYGFLLDNHKYFPDCTDLEGKDILVEGGQTDASFGLGTLGAGTSFASDAELYLEGEAMPYDGQEGAAEPDWLLNPCGDGDLLCSDRGYCAGVHLCLCQRNSAGFAAYAGADCEREVGTIFLDLSYAYGCATSDEDSELLEVVWQGFGTWIGIYGKSEPEVLLDWIEILDDTPLLEENRDYSVVNIDSKGYFAVMYDGETEVNPVQNFSLPLGVDCAPGAGFPGFDDYGGTSTTG